MKLENKFFNAFFYPFLVGVIISTFIISIILSKFSKGYLDKRSAQNVYELEKKYATININSIYTVISNAFLKVQVGLQEQISFYKNIASKITDRSKSKIGKDVYNIINITDLKGSRIYYSSLWFVDRETLSNNDLDPNSDLYQQISVVSQLTQSLYSVYKSLNNSLLNIYFLFEETNLFIEYPYTYLITVNTMEDFYEFKGNPTWCTDKKGNIINHYKIRCRQFYNDIMKAKEEIFDMNINDQPDRKYTLQHHIIN